MASVSGPLVLIGNSIDLRDNNLLEERDWLSGSVVDCGDVVIWFPSQTLAERLSRFVSLLCFSSSLSSLLISSPSLLWVRSSPERLILV